MRPFVRHGRVAEVLDPGDLAPGKDAPAPPRGEIEAKPGRRDLIELTADLLEVSGYRLRGEDRESDEPGGLERSPFGP